MGNLRGEAWEADLGHYLRVWWWGVGGGGWGWGQKKIERPLIICRLMWLRLVYSPYDDTIIILEFLNMLARPISLALHCFADRLADLSRDTLLILSTTLKGGPFGLAYEGACLSWEQAIKVEGPQFILAIDDSTQFDDSTQVDSTSAALRHCLVKLKRIVKLNRRIVEFN